MEVILLLVGSEEAAGSEEVALTQQPELSVPVASAIVSIDSIEAVSSPSADVVSEPEPFPPIAGFSHPPCADEVSEPAASTESFPPEAGLDIGLGQEEVHVAASIESVSATASIGPAMEGEVPGEAPSSSADAPSSSFGVRRGEFHLPVALLVQGFT